MTRSSESLFPAVLALLGVVAVLLLSVRVEAMKCSPDAVRVGPACVDRYEGSVWAVPAGKKSIVKKIESGRMSLAKLLDVGAEQRGEIPRDGCTNDEYGATFTHNGNWTEPLYALSIPGVLPSTCITWFQAEQACRLSGKRLATNEEWQAAAAGTPDPGNADDFTTTCVTRSEFAQPTGSRAACRSRWGAFDMAGNVWEWVAGWINPGIGCTTWLGTHGNDMSCMGAESPVPIGESSGGVSREFVEFNPNLPGAIIRGGNFAVGERNGIFAIFAGVNPHNVSRSTGFRCAR